MGDDGARQLIPRFSSRTFKWDAKTATYRIALDDGLRKVLGELMSQLLALLDDPGAPVMQRLFPPAYNQPTDLERQEEYRRLMQDDLVERHRDECRTVIASLSGTSLGEEQMLAWVKAVNSMRLVLGTYLDVQEDDRPRKPETPEESAYLWLSFLLEESVEALSHK
ncbi:MAG: DUF2017 family protein [Acidimicrobiales bacterium]